MNLNRSKFVAMTLWFFAWCAMVCVLTLSSTPLDATERPRVAVVRSDYAKLAHPVPPDRELTRLQIEEVVRGAMEELGGMEAFVKPDDRWVVIKPNIVHALARGSGDITDAYVVWAVVKLVHEANPSARISIAEAAAGWISPGHPEAMDPVQVTDGFAESGFRQIAEDPDLKEAQLDFIDLNFDEADSVKGVATGDFYWLPRTVRDCDVFINVPVLKVTNFIGFTCAMKNMVGIMPGMKYGWAKNMGFPPWSGNPGLPNHRLGTYDEMIVDITSMARIDLNVVDAIVGLEKGRIAREGGQAVRMNTIIAGADPVAVDAVCTRLVGFNPDDFEFITLGERLGLGVGDLDRMELVGQPLSEVETRFEKKPKEDDRGHYGQGNRTWLLRGPFERKRGEDKEFIDVAHPNAVPGQNGWSQPVYFHDDKIDLDQYYDDPSDCVVYAYATCTAPKDQDAELWVGSGEALRVWINGERVYNYRGARRHRLPNDREPIRIQAGENTVLVRADQTRGRFDFSLNLCETEEDPRYDGSRVRGLKFEVPERETWPEQQVAMQAWRASEGAEMLTDARFVRRYDTLMGSLEGCLHFLREEPSTAYLTGVTGHAFRMCVADSLGMDGPMRVDLPRMLDLYGSLGHGVRLISAREDAPDFRVKQQEAWDAIRESIDRGVPAVARFGPFFWLIKGYHPKREQYYISAFMSGMEEPMEMDELGMDEGLGGLEVLVLGASQDVDSTMAERRSLEFAVEHARSADEVADASRAGNRYHRGFEAFERWIADLETGRVIEGFGLPYTAGVAAEVRGHAGVYLNGIAEHYPEEVAARLREAVHCYGMEVERLKKVAEVFPLMGSREDAGDPEDPEVRRQVVDWLKEALEWDRKAVEALEEALAMMP